MRLWFATTIGAYALMTIISSGAYAQMKADMPGVRETIGYCGNPCVIKQNFGGTIETFLEALRELRQHHIRLVIDGECDSACALLADKARPNACITEHARFGFHKSLQFGILENDLPDSADIRTWVQDRGGYPPHRSLMIMYFEDAVRFWPYCGP